MDYWLFKSEPDVFGIDHLKRDMTCYWDGVRNYQARNFLRDQVKVGDQVFIYHSSCKQVGIAGLAKVIEAGTPDPTQFNPEEKYHDPKSSPDNPRWYQVRLEFVEKYKKVLPLAEIKAHPEITELALVKKGNRLSVMPVVETEFNTLLNFCTK